MEIVYTIERLKSKEDFTDEIKHFMIAEAEHISKLFKDKFNWENFNYLNFADKGMFFVCRRDGELTGVLLCYLMTSPFDFEVKILRQQLLYVKPDSGRTAYHLFKKFIDIGKSKANHIITMLTSQTNIKSQTLENMGFEKLETLYRMEVK